jgi:hypothetical protein
VQALSSYGGCHSIYIYIYEIIKLVMTASKCIELLL